MTAACYNAAPGERQPRSAPQDGPEERVLHLSIAAGEQLQLGQEASLRRLGPYSRVDWWKVLAAQGQQAMERAVLCAAYEHRPTLVWAQVQSPKVLTPGLLRAVRACCGPDAVMVEWTGDVVDYDPRPPGAPAALAFRLQAWLADLCHGVDLLTASCMDYAEEAAALGACSAGFMQCGYDQGQFGRRLAGVAAGDAPLAAWTAHRYPTLEEEDRGELARAVGEALPGVLHVWGTGWAPTPGVALHDTCTFLESSYLYSLARVTVSTSCTNRLRRYTSGRLQRVLASGGCCAVRRFPDMEGLGLVDGVNCLAWETPGELVELLRDWMRPERDGDRGGIREAAAELARGMTWNAAHEEMLWMVREERRRRAAA